MNNLKVVEHNGELVTDSRLVAKMVDKEHYNLVRDIRGYIKIMEEKGELNFEGSSGESNFGLSSREPRNSNEPNFGPVKNSNELNFEPSDFFIPSTYVSEQNKVLPCYLCTKKGCEMIANKMTGEKGVLFTAAYVTEFDRMQKEIPKVKQQVKNERLASVNNAVKILTPLLEKAGCNSKIMLLTAKSLYEKAGVALPIEIEEEKKFYDTKYIAKQCRMFTKSNKPAYQAVAMIIKKLELEEGQYVDTWETNGKWQGTVRKYDDDVISMVKAWLRENDYPESIFYEQYDGEVKQYHVIYKDIVEAV